MKAGSDKALKFFRIEAHELVTALSRDLLRLERQGGEGPELLQACFRYAHTLKGAARVVGQAKIGEIAHAMEDALAPYRESGEAIAAEYISDLLGLLDIVREELSLLEQPALQTQHAPTPSYPGQELPEFVSPAMSEPLDVLRIEAEAFNDILDGIAEASVQLAPLRSGAAHLAHAQRSSRALFDLLAQKRDSLAGLPGMHRWLAKMTALHDQMRVQLLQADRELSVGMARLHSELSEVKSVADNLRLLPAQAALEPLERAVRDAAEWLGKEVRFEVSGASTRLSGHVLSMMREALLHVVRNAVDHGIEPPDERMLKGKPREGKLQVRVERRGDRVAFICSDDGRGMDTEALRKAALAQRLIDEDAAQTLTAPEILKLAFMAGVSTRKTVTEMSGRGVGLDVVQKRLEQLKGEFSVSSEPDRGTKLELVVPISLSSLTALIVSYGNSTSLIPMDCVRGTVRLMESEIVRGESSDSVQFEGRMIPFRMLSELMGESEQRDDTHRWIWTVVIVQWGGQQAALGVDRLVATMEAVVKPLPSVLGRVELLSGAAFDVQGDPLPVLDPKHLLLAAAQARVVRGVAAVERVQQLPILVIDDSLTTRMLEQSILESAGYEVDLASSGEEGLRKAKAGHYSLFIVDVEMPGMNGFEFVERVRSDPALRSVRVMMVTSLSSAADRRRGATARVDAYIVKGEFDQKHFVEKVAELVLV